MQTSPSLLALLKSDDNQQAWQKLVGIYEPLIQKWLRRFSAPDNEIHDVTQETLIVVMQKIKSFEHNSRAGAFRAWLRNITRNCLYKMWREKKLTPIATGKSSFQQILNDLVDDASELSQAWDREYDNHVLNSLLAIIEPEFKPMTWKAFIKVTVSGLTAAEVSDELGISKNAVFIAKSRVLTRLREVGQHLVDE